jgi:hypothetical protein
MKITILVLTLVIFVLPYFSQAQKVNYYYFDTLDHLGVWSIKITDNKFFEFSIVNGGRKSQAFGKVVKKGNKYTLKSKLSNFDIRVSNVDSGNSKFGSIWIAPLLYEDSTEEYDAFIIVDNDNTKKKHLDALNGIYIDSVFGNFRLEIEGKYFTRYILRNEVLGKSVSLKFGEPFRPSSFLNLINNYFYLHYITGKIKLFSKKGRFLCELTPRK